MQHHMDALAGSALEPVAIQRPAVVHVADQRFGRAASAQPRATVWSTYFIPGALPGDEHLDTGATALGSALVTRAAAYIGAFRPGKSGLNSATLPGRLDWAQLQAVVFTGSRRQSGFVSSIWTVPMVRSANPPSQ